MTCSSQIQRVLIPCTNALRQDFQLEYHTTTPDSWFEVFNGILYLRLPMQPGWWMPRRDQVQERNAYVTTLKRVYAPIAWVQLAFEATVKNADLDLQLLLEYIAANCTSPDGTTHTPLRILDFAKPGLGKVLVDGSGNRYTVRVGRIIALDGDSGVFQGNSGRLYTREGFKFIFMEADRRKYLG